MSNKEHPLAFNINAHRCNGAHGATRHGFSVCLPMGSVSLNVCVFERGGGGGLRVLDCLFQSHR